MNICVFMTAYALADDLRRAVDAAAGNSVTFYLFRHSNRPDVVAVCDALNERPNVIYWPYGENRGMSRSINDAILFAQEQGETVFMSINDDVLCPGVRVQQLAQTVVDNPDCAYAQAHGFTERIGKHEPLGFSCCAWNMRAFERVGLFDENFHPFYFMDADWKRRATLLGLTPVTVDTPDVIHAGSKTLTHVEGEADWLAGAFENTLGYYLAKWGGDQNKETYSTPFNNPAIGLTIEKDRRHDPYPFYRPAFRGAIA